MFSLGERVLCIKGGWGAPEGHPFQRACCPNLPRRGVIYTVRTIECVVAARSEGPTWWIRLVEVANPINPHHNVEPIFEAKNFVPLKRTQTDISFAHRILRGVGRKVDA